MKNITYKLDSYLENKSISDILIIHTGVFSLIAFLIYFFAFDVTNNLYEKSLSDNQSILQKIDKSKAFLSEAINGGDLNFSAIQKQKAIEDMKIKLEGLKNDNLKLKENLSNLSKTLFSRQSQIEFLDEITLLADQNNIKILKISKQTKEINQIKSEQNFIIDIDMQGTFIDILSFINEIESSKLIIDINRIDLQTEYSHLIAKIAVAIWKIETI